MLKALDPVSGLMVEPNPGGRAQCQFCKEYVHAKCGEVLGWHWSHFVGKTCEEWTLPEREEREQAARNAKSTASPRHLCTSCREWIGGCASMEPLARDWLTAWGNTEGGVCWFYVGAPQCPAWLWDRPFSKHHDQDPVKSQWRIRDESVVAVGARRG